MATASARVMGSLGRSTLLPLPSGLPSTTPDAKAAAEAALAQSGVWASSARPLGTAMEGRGMSLAAMAMAMN